MSWQNLNTRETERSDERQRFWADIRGLVNWLAIANATGFAMHVSATVQAAGNGSAAPPRCLAIIALAGIAMAGCARISLAIEAGLSMYTNGKAADSRAACHVSAIAFAVASTGTIGWAIILGLQYLTHLAPISG